MSATLPDAVYRRRNIQRLFGSAPIMNIGAAELGYATYEEIVEFASADVGIIERTTRPSPTSVVQTTIDSTESYWKRMASRYWNYSKWDSEAGTRPVDVYDVASESIRLAELMINSDHGLLLNIDTATMHLNQGRMIGPVVIDLYERFFEMRGENAS